MRAFTKIILPSPLTTIMASGAASSKLRKVASTLPSLLTAETNGGCNRDLVQGLVVTYGKTSSALRRKSPLSTRDRFGAQPSLPSVS